MSSTEIERILKRKGFGCQRALGLVILPVDCNILMEVRKDVLSLKELKGHVQISILTKDENGYLIVSSVD